MKNIIRKSILLMLFIAAYSSSMFAGTQTTVYVAIPESTRNGYSVKCNTNHRGDGDDWHLYEMTNTGKTYQNNPVWTCSFTDTYNGLGCIQFQLCDGTEWKAQVQPFGQQDWHTPDKYNNQLWVYGTSNGNTGWIANFSYDSDTPTPNVPTYYINGENGGVAGWGKTDTPMRDWDGIYAYFQLNSGAKFKIGTQSDIYKWGIGSNVHDNNKFANQVTITGSGDNYEVSDGCYIVAFYPIGTDCNSSTEADKPIICAVRSLDDIVCGATGEKYTITFGVIGENGTLKATSAGAEITSGAEVSSVTFTASPASGYEVAGWYSDEAGTAAISGAAGNTYSTTLTADASVYVKFQKTQGTYWYLDEWAYGGGKSWPTSSEDGRPKVCKFTNAENYAYILLPASNAFCSTCNPQHNKFKIGSKNYSVDDNLIAHENCIATGALAGDITLSPSTDGYHNIMIGSVTQDYFYIILYYPNTSFNTQSDYKVAAAYSLPTLTEPVNITFGVIDGVGGTLTAQSGSTPLTSGSLASRATFTAEPIIGYSVEGWYSDRAGETRIEAAGTNTTYTISPATADNNSVFVKFTQSTDNYIFFKNSLGWNSGDLYVYLFTDNACDDNKGVSPRQAIEKGKLEDLGNGLYYYTITNTSNTYKYVCFTNEGGNQSNYENFWDGSNYHHFAWRGDHTKGMPVYIPSCGEDPETRNNAYYHFEGAWLTYNDANSGYVLEITHDVTGTTQTDGEYELKATEVGGFTFNASVALNAGTEYKVRVKRVDNSDYYTLSGFTFNSTTPEADLYGWNDENTEVPRMSLTPEQSGDYTFTLDMSCGMSLSVQVPSTSYRLLYVEQDAQGTITKKHPSHTISKRAATAEAPAYDTIAMHIQPYELRNSMKGDTITRTDRKCYLYLQKSEPGSKEWETILPIDVKSEFTKAKGYDNGVYNFVLKHGDSEEDATIDLARTHRYSGRYYIRTDASVGGWNNYKQLKNYCYYTDYARVNHDFDYYYCYWTTYGTDISYTIACDYSYCVSDTLHQEEDSHWGYTDEYGKFGFNANIRFMWNSFDNTLDRAYISGAGSNLHLLSRTGIRSIATEQEQTSVTLQDQQDWVYSEDVWADAGVFVKLDEQEINNGDLLLIRGIAGDDDFDEDDAVQLLTGEEGHRYKIRVIYDFKTDHLIRAWIPEGNTIENDESIMTDLMVIRTDNGSATQLNFDPSSTRINNVTTAFGVLTLTKEQLETGSIYKRGLYYVSFPFDVHLSEVFGLGTYGEDFLVRYYDGEARSAGWYTDSGIKTFWKDYTDPTNVILKKGFGYQVALDPQKIVAERFQHDNATVSLYFPSANETAMSISGELGTVEVPEHICTRTLLNRDIYDSNWNLIGVPAWANQTQTGEPMQIGYDARVYDRNDEEQWYDYKVGFYYSQHLEDAAPKWGPEKVDGETFQSMYAYLVQWAGIIDWREADITTQPQGLRARQGADGQEAEEYTLRLELSRGETMLDQTFVRLQENGNVTEDFDLNYDMTKIINSGANLYSLIGTRQIEAGANVQPLPAEDRTVYIPLGVIADQSGLYRFSLPDGTEGMDVYISDSNDGTVHSLVLGDYEVALTPGTYEQRFALEISPKKDVTTSTEQVGEDGATVRKVLIDGVLYIQHAGETYTVTGEKL